MDSLTNNFEKYKNKILRLKSYTANINILIVEDYKKLHDELFMILSALFHNVSSAYNGIEALNLYKKNSYDLILSDISMPDMNGVELSSKIRQINIKQEIIILSAHKDSQYLFELINIGVRRFIEKPVSFELLIDELYIVCKELYDINNNVIVSNNIIYKLKEQTIYVENNPIPLTKYEQKLLYMFIKKINQNVSTDEIVSEFYADTIDIDIDNVRKQVYKLRKKLPKDLIKNVHGIGYKIISQM